MRPGTKKQPPLVSIDLDPSRALAGLCILIVEDMGLIALELRWRLEEFDCRVVGVAARLDEATALAETMEMDGVLLDLNLAGRTSYPVAAILERRSIPFILISGYDAGHLRADYATAAHLQKPFTADALSAMMLTTFVRQPRR